MSDTPTINGVPVAPTVAPTVAPAPTLPQQSAREAWLAERRGGLGSSDAAAILGISPWATPLHVYADKVGLSVDHDNGSKRIGRALEDGVATLYRWETDRVPQVPAQAIYINADHPWLRCTPDRLVYESPEDPDSPSFPLEIKTATSYDGWGPSGSREIPPHYLVQVQHQMMVLGVNRADVAVLICGQDFRVYEIPALSELQNDLLDRMHDFWFRHVLPRNPPPPDWVHPGTAELIATISRPATQAVLEMHEEEALVWADKYQEAARGETAGKVAKAEAKAKLILMMGQHGQAVLRDGRRISRKETKVNAYTVRERTQVGFHLTKSRGTNPTNHNTNDEEIPL